MFGFPQYWAAAHVLQEDLYDIHVNFLNTRFFDAKKLYDLYDSFADPLTLDVKALKREYFAKVSRRIHGR
jgi:hypothetical protein